MPWVLGLGTVIFGDEDTLVGPYVLWDSHSYNGTIIPNDGTIGSALDLPVIMESRTYEGVTVDQWTGVLDDGSAYVWDDFFGDADSRSWTQMIAFPEFESVHNTYLQDNGALIGRSFLWPQTRLSFEANGDTNLELQSFSDQLLYSSLGSGRIPIGTIQSMLEDRGALGMRAQAFVTAFTGDEPDIVISGKLLVLNFNPTTRTMSLWLNTELVYQYTVATNSPIYTGYSATSFDGGTSYQNTTGSMSSGLFVEDAPELAFADLWSTFNLSDAYFGSHVAPSGGPAPAPGAVWNSLIGVAAFRGKPTLTEITAWHDYFYTSDFSDDWEDAPEFTVTDGVVLHGNSTGATVAPGYPSTDPMQYGLSGHGNDAYFNTIYAKFQVTETTTVHLSLEGTNFDTLLGVFTTDPPPEPDPFYSSGLHLLIQEGWDRPFDGTWNDDSDDGTWSELTFTAEPGTMYYVGVGGYYDTEYGPVVMTVTFGP